MHKVVAVFAVLAAISIAYPVLACGTEETSVSVGVPDEADNLLSQATRLESSAQSLEVAAISLDRQAERAVARARELRLRANVSGELDRTQVLAQAEQLLAQAAASRANGAHRRAEAAAIRARANGLREQALRLINGGGGRWRGGPRTVAANTI
jgi:hypothetical protein